MGGTSDWAGFLAKGIQKLLSLGMTQKQMLASEAACAPCYYAHDPQRYDVMFCNTCMGMWKSTFYAGPLHPNISSAGLAVNGTANGGKSAGGDAAAKKK